MLVGIYVDYIKIISSSVPFEGAHLKIGKTELTGACLVETGELVVYSMAQDNNSIFTYVVHSDVCFLKSKSYCFIQVKNFRISKSFQITRHSSKRQL